MRWPGGRCSRCRPPRRADEPGGTDGRRSARGSIIATLASSSSAPSTRACSITSPPIADSRRDRILLRRGGDKRKSTGSFYTPQTLTDYVVRRTLHPLVEGASADRILQLRVLDPAMGSAAFLVSACRYLARAYERALIRDGALARNGHRRSGPRHVQAARRPAMPLRRRPESDGGATRAPVALARNARLPASR